MTSTTADIFDRGLLRHKRQRHQQHASEFGFLRGWSENVLSDRLRDIRRTFPIALDLGARLSEKTRHALLETEKVETVLAMDMFAPLSHDPLFFIGDEEFLPVKNASLDLVISNLCLHSVNDLPGTLTQIRSSLKPDGLFMACMFGGETLWQLRKSFHHVEESQKGGISPRVFPFADKQQMGALMQRAGFALPVIDSEILTVTYPNIYKLMKDLRGMGESNIIRARSKNYPGRLFFHEAGQYYSRHYADRDQNLEATFEIIFLIGWSPHNSQQKPMKPGSAKIRLADALATHEYGTGEKATP